MLTGWLGGSRRTQERSVSTSPSVIVVCIRLLIPRLFIISIRITSSLPLSSLHCWKIHSCGPSFWLKPGGPPSSPSCGGAGGPQCERPVSVSAKRCSWAVSVSAKRCSWAVSVSAKRCSCHLSVMGMRCKVQFLHSQSDAAAPAIVMLYDHAGGGWYITVGRTCPEGRWKASRPMSWCCLSRGMLESQSV